METPSFPELVRARSEVGEDVHIFFMVVFVSIRTSELCECYCELYHLKPLHPFINRGCSASKNKKAYKENIEAN